MAHSDCRHLSANVNFTAQERGEINSASRWLRRVVHPFDSFEQILSVRLTPVALPQMSNEHQERRAQNYAAQL